MKKITTLIISLMVLLSLTLPILTVQAKDFDSLGWKLVAQELSHKDTLKILGKPERKSKETMSEVDGTMHQIWYYNGVELDMAKNDRNKLEINYISISKPSNYKTLRNIGIGSTKQEVMKAYKNEFNPEDSDNANITAGTIYGGIMFELKKNHVSKIFIGAAAE